jgi:hypothetical protein
MNVPDPKVPFDILRNYLICGAIIAVANALVSFEYYANCSASAYDFESYSPWSAITLYALAAFMLAWNSLFAIQTGWFSTKGSVLRRLAVFTYLAPIIAITAANLPQKEFGSKDKHPEKDEYGQVQVLSLAEKLCKLEKYLVKTELKTSNILDTMQGKPIYLQRQK